MSRPGARHQPQRGGEAGRRGAELVQRADHFEVEAARIDLADAPKRRAEAEVLEDARFELVDLVRRRRRAA